MRIQTLQQRLGEFGVIVVELLVDARAEQCELIRIIRSTCGSSQCSPDIARKNAPRSSDSAPRNRANSAAEMTQFALVIRQQFFHRSIPEPEPSTPELTPPLRVAASAQAVLKPSVLNKTALYSFARARHRVLQCGRLQHRIETDRFFCRMNDQQRLNREIKRVGRLFVQFECDQYLLQARLMPAMAC